MEYEKHPDWAETLWTVWLREKRNWEQKRPARIRNDEEYHQRIKELTTKRNGKEKTVESASSNLVNPEPDLTDFHLIEEFHAIHSRDQGSLALAVGKQVLLYLEDMLRDLNSHADAKAVRLRLLEYHNAYQQETGNFFIRNYKPKTGLNMPKTLPLAFTLVFVNESTENEFRSPEVKTRRAEFQTEEPAPRQLELRKAGTFQVVEKGEKSKKLHSKKG